MEVYDENETNEQEKQPDDDSDLLQDFIDRKKLQNRILSELLEKIKNAESSHQSHTTNNEKQ